MKKVVIFIILCALLFLSFIYVYNKPKNYKFEYESDKYLVTEEYIKDKKIYNFKVKFDEYEFDYMLEHKYSTNRKIINKFIESKDDDNICLSIKVYKNILPSICVDKDGKYYIKDIEYLKEDVLDTFTNIDIYNKDHEYYLWDGYGLVDIINKKEYHFLDNESYTNNLAYQLDNYILFADYDDKREFDKFYIFDNEEKNIIEWQIDYKISYDSYYMGDYKNEIYLFDKKNNKQYKINVKKQKIEISSDNNGAFLYDKKETNVSLKKAQYNEIEFNNNDLYNYVLENNKLYLSYYNSNKNILISNQNVSSIVSIFNKNIFYLCNENLYVYIYGGDIKHLLRNFEWNFSYENKIFIF